MNSSPIKLIGVSSNSRRHQILRFLVFLKHSKSLLFLNFLIHKSVACNLFMTFLKSFLNVFFPFEGKYLYLNKLIFSQCFESHSTRTSSQRKCNKIFIYHNRIDRYYLTLRRVALLIIILTF